MPVQPPNDMIPPELRRKGLVQRSDLRNERMTDADAREALSDYVVYRFEKVNDPNEIDDEGNPVKSTWENVIRTEVQDLSKPAITRTIRDLDAEGRTAMQKKLDLTGTQQRQIEKAQNNLDAHNLDRRFNYTLQQISTKIRKLSKDSIEYRQYMAGRESKKPRFGEDAKAILKEREREIEQQQRLQEQQRQHHHAQQLVAQQHLHELAIRRQHDEFQRHLPLQGGPPRPPFPLPKPVKEKTDVKVIKTEKGKTKVYNLPSRSSGSSGSSRSDDSWSESDQTPSTSVTGSSDSSRHGHHRGRHLSRVRSRSHSRSRSRRRYHDRPEHYSIKVTRHHTKHDHHLLNDDVLRGLMPNSPPLAPLIMPGGPDHFEHEVFRPRRLADTAYDNELEDIELYSSLGRRRQ
ncbi:hypothetical protein BDP81DRAFT_283682, partial [Colletotrichum phormii]